MTSEAEARGLDEDGVTRVEGRVLAERVRGPAMEGIVAREQRDDHVSEPFHGPEPAEPVARVRAY